MNDAPHALEADWLGACRAARDQLDRILRSRPTMDERVEETGTRGEGGDRTLLIDQEAEDAVFGELESLHGEGYRFSAGSEERGEVDFGDARVRVVVDPLDGSLNAKRGLPAHAISIAGADRPTMGDVSLRYVYHFGTREEWVARRGEGAVLNGEPVPAAGEERRDRDGRLEIVAIESADPRWIAAADLTEVAHRIRALGTIAVSLVQLAAGRVDGFVTLWRTRAADVAAAQLLARESGGRAARGARERVLRVLPGLRRPARRAARSRAALAARRRAHAGGAARAHERADGGEGVIDWQLARRVARFAAGTPSGSPALPGDLDALAAEAEQRVVAYTGLIPGAPLPPPEAVDRQLWAEINLAGMRKVLDPVVERMQTERVGPLAGPLRGAAGTVLALEVGGLTGLLSQRVLGQYELVLLDPDSRTRLLFLAPNLRDAATRLGVDLEELIKWVGFHEVTHAVQFSSVPWLREHLAGLLTELLESVDVQIDPLAAVRRLPTRQDLDRVIASVREGGLVSLVAGAERMAIIDRLQATMAVVEGHAEHVMDAVGREALRDLDVLRNALDRRRAERTGPWKVLERLLGLELKLKQYEVGKRFCDTVADRAGVAGLHVVFESPERLPTWTELQEPDSWMRRVLPDAA